MNKKTTSVNTGANLPEKKFSAGAITATVWKNQKEKNGAVAEYKTVSFERRYKNKAGEWQSTNTFRVNDLPKAALVIEKAYEYIVLNAHEPAIPEEDF
jgi:hypothetical protein